MHDSSLPFSIQTTSVRLILNLVENIFHKNEAESRTLLVRILHCLVSKFATMRDLIPKQLKAVQTTRKPATTGTGAGESFVSPNKLPNEVQSSTTICSRGRGDTIDRSAADSIRECKQLLKTMILGVKTVVWSVSNSRAPVLQPHRTSQASSGIVLQKGMNEAECVLVTRLLKNGLRCFTLYASGPDASAQEEKEVLDYFAGVFTVLDVRNFAHVFQTQIPFLYERVVANTAMSTIIQHFLANSNVSRYFAEILLAFLADHIRELALTQTPQAAVLLRLFKLVFGSITLFPENEPVLRPHLAAIVVSAMRFASNVPQPLYFFSLLRALFKSIGGGKFEHLYKEFLPLLPSLLHGLIRAHASARQPPVRELLLELCLTLPARLSALLPYLHLLVRPLLFSLRSGNELVCIHIFVVRSCHMCIVALTSDMSSHVGHACSSLLHCVHLSFGSTISTPNSSSPCWHL
jgi:transformation/transcription domain-associated protein